MGILRQTKDRKLSSSAVSTPVKPPLLEKLEPRILLSADSLLSAAAPDPLADSTQQAVQYADQLETEQDILQPIMTLSVDQGSAAEEGELLDVNVSSESSTDTDISTDNEAAATDISCVTFAGPTTNISAVPVEDGSMPICSDDADSGIEFATSIEIRGPPVQNQIIFIDSALEQDFQLENACYPGMVVSVFDASQDGIQHITSFLSSYKDISAIHIISHGAPGQVELGTAELTLDSLQSYADQLGSWALALTADADILIYGCSVAQGDDGLALVDGIAGLTGADVAASTDPTGAAELGGDWVLEKATGFIEAGTLTENSWTYPGLLANIQVNSLIDGAPNNDGNLTLREAILIANDNSGVTSYEGISSSDSSDTITFDSALVSAGDATITLTEYDTGLDPDEFGPSAFIISTTITIQGPAGDYGITIERDDTGDAFRLFTITTAGNLTMENLTFSKGQTPAGSNGTDGTNGNIFEPGGNGSAGQHGQDGGGFYNVGTLILNNSTVSGNTTGAGGNGGDGGDGLFVGGNGGNGGRGGRGGGIFN
ncbi:MAG: DUF4347 domain-containing protein, partial [Planctomycetota bacterium]